MMLRWRITRADFPVALSACLMLLGGLLLVINLLMGLILGKHMKLCDGMLHGVVTPAPVVSLSLEHVLDGSFQQSFGLRTAKLFPYQPVAIRLRGQIEYSLFNSTANDAIIVGRGGQLLETNYITAYCARGLAAYSQNAPAWAADIKQMQDAAARHGQQFIYVLTPSKVAQYPEYVPGWIPCPSTQADRTQLVPYWLKLLREDGVNAVDLTAPVRAAHAQYPFPLFPHGGIHWNEVGAAIGAQALAAQLNTQLGRDAVPPFQFTWKMSAHPKGADDDLATLMNLYWPPVRYEVPLVEFQQNAAENMCEEPRVVEIGGSFMEKIGADYSRLPCQPDFVGYFYFDVKRFRWKDGKEITTPANTAQRDEDLRAAQVIIYEENEQVLGVSHHGALLFAWMKENYGS